MEEYILFLIKNLNKKIDTLCEDQKREEKKRIYNKRDYELLFCRYSGQKNILYIVLSGHQNGSIIEEIKKEDLNDKASKK